MRPSRFASVGTLAVACSLALVACPPNEAVVCASRTENVAAGCVAHYDLCNGDKYRLECSPASGGGGVECACVEDGAKKKTFASADACNVTPDTLKKRAAEGCTWNLGLE